MLIDMRKTKNNKKDNDHINKILVFLGENYIFNGKIIR